LLFHEVCKPFERLIKRSNTMKKTTTKAIKKKESAHDYRGVTNSINRWSAPTFSIKIKSFILIITLQNAWQKYSHEIAFEREYS
jgi:hypothetical protein